MESGSKDKSVASSLYIVVASKPSPWRFRPADSRSALLQRAGVSRSGVRGRSLTGAGGTSDPNHWIGQTDGRTSPGLKLGENEIEAHLLRSKVFIFASVRRVSRKFCAPSPVAQLPLWSPLTALKPQEFSPRSLGLWLSQRAVVSFTVRHVACSCDYGSKWRCVSERRNSQMLHKLTHLFLNDQTSIHPAT